MALVGRVCVGGAVPLKCCLFEGAPCYVNDVKGVKIKQYNNTKQIIAISLWVVIWTSESLICLL